MSDDRVTSRGTVKGHGATPEDAVTEGGKAASPVDTGGVKPSASKAHTEGVPDDDASAATAGSAEKAYAAEAGAAKTQSGRGHRKD